MEHSFEKNAGPTLVCMQLLQYCTVLYHLGNQNIQKYLISNFFLQLFCKVKENYLQVKKKKIKVPVIF